MRISFVLEGWRRPASLWQYLDRFAKRVVYGRSRSARSANVVYQVLPYLAEVWGVELVDQGHEGAG